jgi:glycopeptide antibiotics resistance protein
VTAETRGARVAYAIAAAAAAALIVYGSLVPFDFRTPADSHDLHGFVLLALAGTSRTDFVSNVLLFLPFPFFLMGAICFGRRERTRAVWGAPIVAVVTGTLVWAVEWFQQFLPTRTASWNDVAASVVAAMLGAIVWLVAGDVLTRWAARVVAERQPRTGLEAALIVYTVAIAVLQVLPLDVTIRPAELLEKYRAGRIRVMPFASALPFDAGSALDVAGDMLRALPFGLLGLIGWMPAGVRRAPASAFLVGLTVVAVIEGAQLFVFSRVFDLTDVLTGAAGVAIGVWIGRRVRSAGVSSATASHPVMALAGLAAWTLVLLVRHWYPFDFTLDLDLARARLPELMTVPFSAYYSANPFAALNDAAEKLMLAVPVGALLWLLVRPGTAETSRLARRLALLALSALFFLAFEIGQVFLPGRYPDITDVIVGVAGTALGMVLASRWRSASATEAALKSRPAGRPEKP